MASVLFGTPPSSTMQEALDHFAAAEELEPGFWNKNHLYLAMCYRALGKKEESAAWLTTCLAATVRSEDDERVQKEAQELAKKWGVSA